MIDEQCANNDTFICFEQSCHLSRIITSWDQLKLHNQFNHRVISKQKFETKFNQQQRIKIQENINQLIQQQEKRIIGKIQELFEIFKKSYFDIFQDQVSLDYQLSNSQFMEADIQKQIQIYYGKIQAPQQEQADIFLDEIYSKLNLMEIDLLNLLEKNLIVGNQYSNNIQIQNSTQFNDSTLPKSVRTKTVENHSQQTELIQNNIEQFKYEAHSIPLKGYKQFSFQEENYSNHTENNSNLDDDDRLKFQLPSEIVNSQKNSQSKSNNNNNAQTELQEYIITSKKFNEKSKNDKIEQKTELQEFFMKKSKNSYKKSSTKNIFYGKKFDIPNSYQNLSFSKNSQAFSCYQQGIGLVDGILNLQIDAEIRLKFSKYQNKKFQAEIGILNVDRDGKMKGSEKYYINEQGELISNGQAYQGKFQISLDQEYLISYSSDDRILFFINGKIEEYLNLEKVKGWFKFYVKLQGSNVQILC